MMIVVSFRPEVYSPALTVKATEEEKKLVFPPSEKEAYMRFLGLFATRTAGKVPYLGNVVRFLFSLQGKPLTAMTAMQSTMDIATQSTIMVNVGKIHPTAALVVMGSLLADISLKPIHDRLWQEVTDKNGNIKTKILPAIGCVAIGIVRLPYLSIRTVSRLPGLACKETLVFGKNMIVEMNERSKKIQPLKNKEPLAIEFPDAGEEAYFLPLLEYKDNEEEPAKALALPKIEKESSQPNVIRFTPPPPLVWKNPYNSLLDKIDFRPSDIPNSVQIGISISGNGIRGNISVGPTSSFGWDDIVAAVFTLKNLMLHGSTTHTQRLQLQENLTDAFEDAKWLDISRSKTAGLSQKLAELSQSDSLESLEEKLKDILKSIDETIRADQKAMSALFQIHKLARTTRQREYKDRNVVSKKQASKLKDLNENSKNILWQEYKVPRNDKLRKEDLTQSEKIQDLANLKAHIEIVLNNIPLAKGARDYNSLYENYVKLVDQMESSEADFTKALFEFREKARQFAESSGDVEIGNHALELDRDLLSRHSYLQIQSECDAILQKIKEYWSKGEFNGTLEEQERQLCQIRDKVYENWPEENAYSKDCMNRYAVLLFWMQPLEENLSEVNALLEERKGNENREANVEFNRKSLIVAEKLIVTGDLTNACSFIDKWSQDQQNLSIEDSNAIQMAELYLSVLNGRLVKPNSAILERLVGLLQKDESNNILLIGHLIYLSNEGLSQKALQTYKACLEKQPENANWLGAIAQVLANNLDWKQCELYIKQARELDKTNEAAAAAALQQAHDQYRIGLLEFEVLRLLLSSRFKKQLSQGFASIAEIAVRTWANLFSGAPIDPSQWHLKKKSARTIKALDFALYLISNSYVAPKWLPQRLPTSFNEELTKELASKESPVAAASFALTVSQYASKYIERRFPQNRVIRWAVNSVALAQTSFVLGDNVRTLYQGWQQGNLFQLGLPLTAASTASAVVKFMPQAWLGVNGQAFFQALQAPNVSDTSAVLSCYLRYNDLAGRFSKQFGDTGTKIYTIADTIFKSAMFLKLGFNVYQNFFQCKANILLQNVKHDTADNPFLEAKTALRRAKANGLDKRLASCCKVYMEACTYISLANRSLKAIALLEGNETLVLRERKNYASHMNKVEQSIIYLEKMRPRISEKIDRLRSLDLIRNLKIHQGYLLFEAQEFKKAKKCLKQVPDCPPHALVILSRIAINKERPSIEKGLHYLDRAIEGYEGLAYNEENAKIKEELLKERAFLIKLLS